MWLAGGWGSKEERKENRLQWKKWCFALLSPIDQARRKKASIATQTESIKANIAAKTEQKLAATPHAVRICGSTQMEAVTATVQRGFGIRLDLEPQSKLMIRQRS